VSLTDVSAGASSCPGGQDLTGFYEYDYPAGFSGTPDTSFSWQDTGPSDGLLAVSRVDVLFGAGFEHAEYHGSDGSVTDVAQIDHVLLNGVWVDTYSPSDSACAAVGNVQTFANLTATSYAPGQGNTFTLRRTSPSCFPSPTSGCSEVLYSGFGVNSGWASYGTNIVALVTVTY
jgi:hypothetical protein